MEPEKDSSLSSRKPSVLRGLLGILLFGVSALIFSKFRTPLENAGETVPPQDKADKPAGTKEINSAFVSNVPPTVREEDQANRSKDDTPGWKKFVEIAIGAGTVGLLVVNIFLLWATKEANSINREALESVQRAFVSFQRLSLDVVPATVGGKEKQWLFTAFFENSGTTPAVKKIQFFDDGSFPDGHLPENRFIGSVKNAPVGEIGSKAVKSPSPKVENPSFILGNFTLTEIGRPEFLKSIQSRNILFWGWMGYRDVFHVAHVTEFCEHVEGVEVGFPNTPENAGLVQKLGGWDKAIEIGIAQPRVLFTECSEHNCTDDNCPDQREILPLIPE